MSTGLANFLFEAANFLILAAVLLWVLFRPVRAALDAESARHREEVEEAHRLRAEAEASVREQEEQHANLERELDRERAERRAAAEKEAAEIRESARSRVLAERKALERELASDRRQQAEALADTLGELTAAMVRRLLTALEGPSLDLALVRGGLSQLSALPAPALEEARVETARPLEPEARRLLEDVLGGFEERLVPALGAGVRITTPAGQVDASALSLARQAALEVARAAEGEQSVDDASPQGEAIEASAVTVPSDPEAKEDGG